jgi:hypothetical protein
MSAETFEFTGEFLKEAERNIAKYPHERRQSAVLSLLFLAQEQNHANGHYVTEAAMRKIAEMLNMPFIRVMEVSTFFTMINLAPVGEFHIQLCGTTPCMLHADRGRMPGRLLQRADEGLYGLRGRTSWRAPGPQNGRIPDRAEMVLHAEGVERTPPSRRYLVVNRRRNRARHLQGPRDHAERPAYLHRRLPDLASVAMAPAPLLHLHPRRIPPRGKVMERAIAEAYEAGLVGKNACGSGYDFDIYMHPRRRRLYLRRGNGAARKPGRQEGPAAPEAAVPGDGGPLRLPDHREQRRDHRRVTEILRRGADWFAGFGRENNSGTKLFCVSGHVEQAVQRRGSDVASRSRS